MQCKKECSEVGCLLVVLQVGFDTSYVHREVRERCRDGEDGKGSNREIS